MQALGIDIGSTSIKGAVLDLDSSMVQAPLSRAFPAAEKGLPPGWVEINPKAVSAVVDELLMLLLEKAPHAEMLCVSGQMGGLALLDERANPLSNYISWRDQRTLSSSDSVKSIFEHARQQWEADDCFVELGRELQAGSTTVLLAWLNSHGQLPPSAIPHSIADVVVARLVGHAIPMHATHAIGMIDLTSDRWHYRALQRLGVERVKLPELITTEPCIGSFQIGGRKLRVYGSYGDQQCALRGAGLQRDELSLNISTGSQVSRREAKFSPGNYQSRKYFFGDTLDTITHLPAGRSLNVLVDLATELARAQGIDLRNPWDTINQLVDSVSDTDLKIDLAFFRGPLGQRGRIDNISTENFSIGHLFHAAMVSMVDNFAGIAERFSSSWRRGVLSGGLAQNLPRLRVLLKERFSMPLRESSAEETLSGLLDIAQECSGYTSQRRSTAGSCDKSSAEGPIARVDRNDSRRESEPLEVNKVAPQIGQKQEN